METTLKLLKDLIKFDTSNPPADTRGISHYLGRLLERNNIPYRLLKKKGNRVYKHSFYLLSEIGRGSKCITLYGHSDVVPVGELSKWDSDPFTPVERDGRVYGRGSTDMKSGLAVLVSTYMELAKERGKLGGRVQLLVCPDEENYLNKEKLLPEIIAKHETNACIMAEPHSSIMIGEKGEMWLKFIAKGKAAHGSTPYAGEDAGIILNDAIEEIRKIVNRLNYGYSKRQIKIRDLLEEADKNMAEEFGLTGKRRASFVKNRPSSRITMNVGYVRIGHNINVVPDEAEAHISFVMPYGFDYMSLKGRILKMFSGYEGKIAVTLFGGSNATMTDARSGLVKAMVESYKEVHGADPKITFNTSTSDAMFYRRVGIPTILHGPGRLAMAHKNNEFVEIADLEPAKRVFLKAVKKFLATKS